MNDSEQISKADQGSVRSRIKTLSNEWINNSY